MTRLCLYEEAQFPDDDFGVDPTTGVEIHLRKSPKHTPTGELVDDDLPGAEDDADERELGSNVFLEEGRQE